MTLDTALSTHYIGVGPVTVLTGLNLAVIIVAGGTGKAGMDARIGSQLLNLLGMAGQASVGDFFGQTDVKRRVRVDMAADATLEAKMGGPGMTTAAGGDYFHIGRRMAPVTVEAEGLVGLPVFPEGTDNALVALLAVFRGDSGCHRLTVKIEPFGPNRGQPEKPAKKEASYHKEIFIKFQTHAH
jgi:hypothetical protein